MSISRKVRCDKKRKILAGLSTDSHDKLQKLAISCNLTKTKLAEHILDMAVNNENIIHWYQSQFNQDPKYRITTMKQGDHLEYL